MFIMNRNSKLITLVIAALLIIAGGEGLALMTHHNNKPSKPVGATTQTYTRLNIELKDGQLTSGAATYLVQPGTPLEFHISSNIFGKVSVPTKPPQTITFMKSPLVFRFNASDIPGTYPLLYEASGSSNILQIGTIIVRGS